MITTQKALRRAFWEHVAPLGIKPVPGWTQNQYAATTRTYWCDYVETQYRNRQITAALAQRAAL